MHKYVDFLQQPTIKEDMEIEKNTEKSYRTRPDLAKKMVSHADKENVRKNTITRIQMTDGVLIPNKNDNHVLNSWRITFFVAIALLGGLVLFKPDPFRSIFLVAIKGAPMTFQVTIMSIIGAIIIGLFCGLGAVSKSRIVNMISGVYVEFIRGIPLLVQLIFIYYAMGRLLKIEGLVAAVAALSICFGAYMGEIIQIGRASCRERV